MAPVEGESSSSSLDRLVIQLRAYVEAKQPATWDLDRAGPSNVSVIFDTETTTEPSQRLRFGAYQIREGDSLLERGLFYAEDMPASDLATLTAEFEAMTPTNAGEQLRLLTRAEFVDQIIFGHGLETGALIIGFNLPFDLSRIATRHTYAKGSYKGAFSFRLAEGRPNIRIKYLSQRASFIQFTGKDANDKAPDRGYFIDVKTLAAALTSASHSLQSLTKLLGVTSKEPLEDYGGPLTPEKIAYGLNDVQATWECFAALRDKYDAYGLTQTRLDQLYSEASLGKAFLGAMGVTPWRQMQGSIPPALIGQIMSTYYGGRAEVHIRREITPVIHCDFRSMYPTVCTLMGLWDFVIAQGIEYREATAEVRRFVDECSLETLRDPATWRRWLACIVQIEPDDDVLPIRAVYPGATTATIGSNPLTSGEPLWFTLADVLTAKLLGGHTPKIVSAIRFEPKRPQFGLRPITLEGETLWPKSDDFYKRLIDQRGRIQAEEKVATGADKARLKSASQSLKILANSTSYGIFVEINVQTLDQARRFDCYDFRGRSHTVKASKKEEPGRFFHPLLGTLITGAARLMLGLAERNVLGQGLDWAFCDTDSLAIANTQGLSDESFIERVEAVRDWFTPLNPYEKKGSILQLEKVNFPPGRDGDMTALRPVNCLAISAKRYVLFDRDEGGAPVIRKASAHGLGHLVPPYRDPERSARIDRIGVELWQEDLWKAVIGAHDDGDPDVVDYGALPGFDQPAVSRYAATNQALLKWFAHYNETAPHDTQVWPFNFLLSFQAKSHIEMQTVDPDALARPIWKNRVPHPASRYSSDLTHDRPEVFDRMTGEPIPWSWLKSVARSLTRHHLHPELKFEGGDDDQRGTLKRRHVLAWAISAIGKEADNLDEREALGEGEDDGVEWGLDREDHRALRAEILKTIEDFKISDRTLIERARIGRASMVAFRRRGRVALQTLLNLATAAEALRREAQAARSEGDEAMASLRRLAEDAGSIAKAALRLGLTRQYVGRVLRGEKPMTDELAARLRKHPPQPNPISDKIH